MKNKIIMLLLAVAIFIPSVVAIVSYNSTRNAPVSDRNIRAITVNDLAANEFSFSKDEKDGEDMIDFFLAMNAASSPVASLPDPLQGTAFFKVTMSSVQQSAEYQYYFSTDAQRAYFLNPDGKAFAIPEEYAAEFLSSRYAVSLYVNAVVPTLTLSEHTVLPASASWLYKNSAGTYVACEPETSAQSQKVSLEGGLQMAFSLNPDYFTVKLTDTASGNVVFSDLYSKIDTLTLDRSMVMKVEVDAKWYEDAARDYHGEMHYSFTADIAAPAEFKLGHTSVESGYFTTILAKNIKDVAKIQFSTTPDMGYTPTFFMEGETAVALLPIGCELAAGKYTLNLKYGGVSEDITLEVTARNIRHFNYSIKAAIVNATRTEKTMADFDAATAALHKTGDATRYFDGMFAEPVVKTSQYHGVITTGFGHLRKISGTDVSYTHLGVDYNAAKGAEVFAGNAGKVVFAAYTELAGNTVVIEHGYGLKTWYSHLSEMKVAVGDSVTKGAVIGIVGSDGFTNQTGVHAGMSIYGVAVSPYLVWYDEALKTTW